MIIRNSSAGRKFAKLSEAASAAERSRPPVSLKSQFSRSTDGAAPKNAAALRLSSRRSARQKFALVVLACVLATVGTVAGGYYFAMRPVTLRIAVGPPNSDDFKVVQSMTQAFLREHKPVRLRPVTTEGATASAIALADRKADLAIIRGDLEIPKNALAVATLRKNVVVIWVPPAKDAQPAAKGAAPKKGAKPAATKGKITKIPDLVGHRIGVIGRTQANVNLLYTILDQYAVDRTKVQIVQFSTNEVAEAVRGQKADVFLAAGPVNSKITSEAIQATSRDGGEPTFLPVDLADALAARRPVYEAAEIPEGAFGGTPNRPDDEVKTVSFSHHIVARQGISDATVASLARQIFASRQALLTEFPLSAKIETPDTDKDAVIPVHPGAAAYVDGEEKSFLDRYSDYIWFTLIGLSAMGSIGAWFASYLKKDERNNNANLRERLLEMLTKARSSHSMEELDRMQAEADEILRDTLTCFEQGAIEQGALTAFNIAIEQFHYAVADRKTFLNETAQMVQSPPVALRAGAAG